MKKSPNTILRLLKRRDVKIVLEDIGDNYKGYVYHETRVIHIDHHQQIKERVSTLIHEALHLLNPKAHEYLIGGVEKEVVAKLTKMQFNEFKKFII